MYGENCFEGRRAEQTLKDSMTFSYQLLTNIGSRESSITLNGEGLLRKL